MPSCIEYPCVPNVTTAIPQVNSTRDKATNNWRLLDCQGHRVSDRKDDLKAMLDHLSIDAANPLAVMTQVRCSAGEQVHWPSTLWACLSRVWWHACNVKHAAAGSAEVDIQIISNANGSI